jgi:hypothetical protein
MASLPVRSAAMGEEKSAGTAGAVAGAACAIAMPMKSKTTEQVNRGIMLVLSLTSDPINANGRSGRDIFSQVSKRR